jgi:hypothetical protein
MPYVTTTTPRFDAVVLQALAEYRKALREHKNAVDAQAGAPTIPVRVTQLARDIAARLKDLNAALTEEGT